MSHIWTTLVRGDRDFDKDIDERVVARARKHLTGPYALHRRWGNTINVKRPFYNIRVDGVIGRPQEIAEGVQAVPLAVPTVVADMKLRVKLMGLGILLSKERVDDEGDSGLIQKLVPKIMERQNEALEIAFQQMLLVNPTVYNPLRDLRDGVAWASTAHPAGPMGDSWANTFAAPTDLTEDTLQQVVASFYNYVDENGDRAPLMPTRFELGVAPAMLQKARQTVLSMSTLADNKNSGVLNAANVGGITWDVAPLLYATSNTAWMVRALGDDNANGVTIAMREAPGNPKKVIRENPDQVQYYSKARWGMGITDPRGLFYSPGA